MLLVFVVLLIPRLVLCEIRTEQFSEAACLNEGNKIKALTTDESSEFSKLSLPAGMELIGEEAFEGTAFTSIHIPENVKEIEDRAFAGIKQLLIAHISSEEIDISDNVFDEDNNLLLSGFAGSSVQRWANGRKIRFVLMEQIREKNETADYNAYVPNKKKEHKRAYLDYSIALSDPDLTKARQNTYRTNGDLKASCYTGIASIYVQSRYFP